jgi:hypothetical protein
MFRATEMEHPGIVALICIALLIWGFAQTSLLRVCDAVGGSPARQTLVAAVAFSKKGPE